MINKTKIGIPSRSVEKSQGKEKNDYSTKFDDIFTRLKDAVGAKSDNDLGEALGLRQQTISAARSKKQIPPGWVVEISAKFGVSADWILYGEGPVRRGENQKGHENDGISQIGENDRRKSYIMLKWAKPKVNEAGELFVGNESWEHIFVRNELDKIGTPEKIAVMMMPGNDMFPVIKDKNSILIDTSQTNMVSDYIYAVYISEAFLIRRLTVAGNNIVLSGYNCESVEIPPDEIKILGRVVYWISG
ncbi:MAG: hypothetical protein GYA47_14140 [Desulfovibrio sp.]|nr:hypothetical protein [Desulfovibrio sp.]